MAEKNDFRDVFAGYNRARGVYTADRCFDGKTSGEIGA